MDSELCEFLFLTVVSGVLLYTLLCALDILVWTWKSEDDEKTFGRR